MRRRAQHDGGRPDAGGVLRDQPPGTAVIGRVQQDLALGGHVMRGELVQVRADQVPGGVQVLGVDADVSRGDAFPGVHHVDDLAARPGPAGPRPR